MARTAGRFWPFRSAAFILTELSETSHARPRQSAGRPSSRGFDRTERQTIDGLSLASDADLDGDGLTDLWGLMARCVPFAARAGSLARWRVPVGGIIIGQDARRCGAFGGFRWRRNCDSARQTRSGSRRLVWPADGAAARLRLARSGRDGRVIWKSLVDPREAGSSPIVAATAGLRSVRRSEG